MVHESCSIQSRKQVLQGVVQNGRFLQTEKGRIRKLLAKEKTASVQFPPLFCRERRSVVFLSRLLHVNLQKNAQHENCEFQFYSRSY